MSKTIDIENAAGTSCWKFKIENERIAHLERKIVLEASHRVVDVQGPLTMCALARVRTGTTSFYRGDSFHDTPAEYALFAPAYSVIEWCFEDVHLEIEAIMTMYSGFDCSFGAIMIPRLNLQRLPRTLEEMQSLAKYICNSHDAIPLERCIKPTSLSRKVKKAVDQTFAEEIKISQIARKLATAPSVVSRQFSRDYGLSPAEYRKRVRIIAASFMLVNGEEIIHASDRAGYPDLSGFYKHFREIATVPPAHFSSRKSKNTKK